VVTALRAADAGAACVATAAWRMYILLAVFCVAVIKTMHTYFMLCWRLFCCLPAVYAETLYIFSGLRYIYGLKIYDRHMRYLLNDQWRVDGKRSAWRGIAWKGWRCGGEKQAAAE
jgi:hypothetical protein